MSTGVMTAEEVRQTLRTSRTEVARLRRIGQLKAIRIGTGSKKAHWRYLKTSVDRLLETGGNGEAP